MTVARLVAGRVDIDIPGQRRPAVGDHLLVERDGVVIAELEVTLLDIHRASCRIVKMTEPIAGGDLVRPAAADQGVAAPPPGSGTADEHPSNQSMIVQRVLRGAVDISLVSSQPVAVGDRLVNCILTVKKLSLQISYNALIFKKFNQIQIFKHLINRNMYISANVIPYGDQCHIS